MRSMKSGVAIGVKYLDHYPADAPELTREDGDSGFDLRAAANMRIPTGQRALVPTGIKLDLPAGFEGQVRSRSGLALKHGIAVLNSPGTVDASYKGEVCVVLINTGAQAFDVKPGDRIAQIVFAQLPPVKITAIDDVGTSARGSGGFGSTGTA